MAGIFDYMQRPGMDENERAMNAHFLTGVLIRRIGLNDSVDDLEALINLELDTSGPITAEAKTELGDIAAWVQSGASVNLKIANLGFVTHIFAMYEQSRPDYLPWITEAEARTILTNVGVSFS